MTRRNSKVGTSWHSLDPTCMERPCAATPRACFPLMATRSTHRPVIALSTRGLWASGIVKLSPLLLAHSVGQEPDVAWENLALPWYSACLPLLPVPTRARQAKGTSAHVLCTARVLGN